jgi:hypothetical protein
MRYFSPRPVLPPVSKVFGYGSFGVPWNDSIDGMFLVETLVYNHVISLRLKSGSQPALHLSDTELFLSLLSIIPLSENSIIPRLSAS